MWHWLQHVTGVDDLSGPWYGWWSGFAGDIPEFAILGGLMGAYRKHACHARWCFRLGHHRYGEYVVCRRHHPNLPDKPPTATDLRGMQ